MIAFQSEKKQIYRKNKWDQIFKKIFLVKDPV